MNSSLLTWSIGGIWWSQPSAEILPLNAVRSASQAPKDMSYNLYHIGILSYIPTPKLPPNIYILYIMIDTWIFLSGSWMDDSKKTPSLRVQKHHPNWKMLVQTGKCWCKMLGHLSRPLKVSRLNRDLPDTPRYWALNPTRDSWSVKAPWSPGSASAGCEEMWRKRCVFFLQENVKFERNKRFRTHTHKSCYIIEYSNIYIYITSVFFVLPGSSYKHLFP